jgi:hypothetical protein
MGGAEWGHQHADDLMMEKKLTVKVPQRKSEAAEEPPLKVASVVASVAGGGGGTIDSRLLTLPSPRSNNGCVLAEPTGRLDDYYVLGKELGRGHFGVVRTCEELETGQQLACKSIDKKHLQRR